MASYFARRFSDGEFWVLKIRIGKNTWKQYRTKIAVERDTKGDVTLSSARKANIATQRIQSAVDKGEDVFSKKKSWVGAGLRYVCEEFYRSRVDRWTQGTAVNRRNSVDKALEFFGDKDVREIDTREIDRYRKKLGLSVAAATVNMRLVDLYAVLRFARTILRIEKMPELKRELMQIPESEEDYLTVEELESVLVECKSLTLNGESIYDFILFAVSTGMRRGEILMCRREWIRNRVISLPGSIKVGNKTVRVTKNGKGRRIPVWGEMGEILARCPKDGLLFPKMTSEISRRFKIAVQRAGIKRNVHFHNLRDTFAVHAVDRGVSMRVVQQIVGDDLRVLRRHYLAVSSDDLVSAISGRRGAVEVR